VRVVLGATEAARSGSAACGTIRIELARGTVRIIGMADLASMEGMAAAHAQPDTQLAVSTAKASGLQTFV
jgi:hypothetical protein